MWGEFCDTYAPCIEKAEKENSHKVTCEYCSDNIDIVDDETSLAYDEFRICIVNKGLSISSTCWDCKTTQDILIDIKYCPICGRRL